jgi:hypothetical protein
MDGGSCEARCVHVFTVPGRAGSQWHAPDKNTQKNEEDEDPHVLGIGYRIKIFSLSEWFGVGIRHATNTGWVCGIGIGRLWIEAHVENVRCLRTCHGHARLDAHTKTDARGRLVEHRGNVVRPDTLGIRIYDGVYDRTV